MQYVDTAVRFSSAHLDRAESSVQSIVLNILRNNYIKPATTSITTTSATSSVTVGVVSSTVLYNSKLFAFVLEHVYATMIELTTSNSHNYNIYFAQK